MCVLLYVPRTFNKRMVHLCFLTFHVVGRDLVLSDSAAAVNLTRYNRINSVEKIGSNPTRKKMYSLNPFNDNKARSIIFQLLYLFIS